MPKLYRVMKSVVDAQNGFEFRAGKYLSTDCEKWVARMGSALKQELSAPKGAEIIEIKSTVEEEEASEPAKEEEASEPAKKEVSKRAVPNKAVGDV